MAIPDKDKGQSISLDQIEDEFLFEDDGDLASEQVPIRFGSFRGELGTLFGVPLKFSDFSGKSIDPDITPITITGGTLLPSGLREYTLQTGGTLTSQKVAAAYGEVAEVESITWTQTSYLDVMDLGIDGQTGLSVSFTAGFALEDLQIDVRATARDWQGDESYEDISFIVKAYDRPDGPEPEDLTVYGLSQDNPVIWDYDFTKTNTSVSSLSSSTYVKPMVFDVRLTEGSAYHPYGLDYDIEWEIISLPSWLPSNKISLQTLEESDGRKYLRVTLTAAPEDRTVDIFDVVIRGTATDVFNPNQGPNITLKIARQKNELDEIDWLSKTTSIRTNATSLPQDQKVTLPPLSQIREGDLLLLEMQAEYTDAAGNLSGVLDLPAGYIMPLVGESNSSPSKINWNTRWGKNDGWVILSRIDAPLLKQDTVLKGGGFTEQIWYNSGTVSFNYDFKRIEDNTGKITFSKSYTTPIRLTLNYTSLGKSWNTNTTAITNGTAIGNSGPIQPNGSYGVGIGYDINWGFPKYEIENISISKKVVMYAYMVVEDTSKLKQTYNIINNYFVRGEEIHVYHARPSCKIGKIHTIRSKSLLALDRYLLSVGATTATVAWGSSDADEYKAEYDTNFYPSTNITHSQNIFNYTLNHYSAIDKPLYPNPWYIETQNVSGHVWSYTNTEGSDDDDVRMLPLPDARLKIDTYSSCMHENFDFASEKSYFKRGYSSPATATEGYRPLQNTSQFNSVPSTSSETISSPNTSRRLLNFDTSTKETIYGQMTTTSTLLSSFQLGYKLSSSGSSGIFRESTVVPLVNQVGGRFTYGNSHSWKDINYRVVSDFFNGSSVHGGINYPQLGNGYSAPASSAFSIDSSVVLEQKSDRYYALTSTSTSVTKYRGRIYHNLSLRTYTSLVNQKSTPAPFIGINIDLAMYAWDPIYENNERYPDVADTKVYPEGIEDTPKPWFNNFDWSA